MIRTTGGPGSGVHASGGGLWSACLEDTAMKLRLGGVLQLTEAQ